MRLSARRVDAQKRVGRQSGYSSDARLVVANGQHQAFSLNDARLAQHHELLGGKRRIWQSELTVSGAALEPTRQITERAPETVLPKRIGKVRETSGFSDDDAVKPHGVRFEQNVDDRQRRLHEAAAQIRSGVARQRLKRIMHGVAGFFEKRREQSVFAGEMIVKRAFGNAGRAGNLGHGRAFVPGLKKNFAGAGQDLSAFGLERFARAAGLWCCGSRAGGFNVGSFRACSFRTCSFWAWFARGALVRMTVRRAGLRRGALGRGGHAERLSGLRRDSARSAARLKGLTSVSPSGDMLTERVGHGKSSLRTLALGRAFSSRSLFQAPFFQRLPVSFGFSSRFSEFYAALFFPVFVGTAS